MDLRSIRPGVAGVCLFTALAASSVVHAFTKDVAVGFDELAHVSYIDQIQRCRCSPALTELTLLDPRTMLPTTEPNYLNHPEAYYRLMALGPAVSATSLPWLRLINASMVAAAVALLFAAISAAVSDRTRRIAGFVVVGTVPVLAQLGGSVNNDNLAILGGALTVFGAVRYRSNISLWNLVIMCSGALIASLAKATGLMLSAGFVAAFLLQMKPPWRHFAIATVFAIVSIVPYAILAARYGSPVPETPGQLKMLADGASLAGWDQQSRLSPWSYAVWFAWSLLEGWMPHVGGRTVIQEAALVLPAGIFALAAAGVRRDAVCRAGALAVLVTFAVHIAFSYRRHLETGWMLDAYPRYYFPLLGVLPLAVANALERTPKWVTVAAISAPLAFAFIG